MGFESRRESQSSPLLFIKPKLTTGDFCCGLTAAGIEGTAYPDRVLCRVPEECHKGGGEGTNNFQEAAGPSGHVFWNCGYPRAGRTHATVRKEHSGARLRFLQLCENNRTVFLHPSEIIIHDFQRCFCFR